MRYETESWMRSLEFIKEENELLKQRLADLALLRNGISGASGGYEFQNILVNNDAMIALLKNEIQKHRQLLRLQVYTDEMSMKNALKFQLILREDMDKFEKSFSRLQVNFNSWIAHVSNKYPVAA